MVKGSARQIILVKSPDPKLFDEAIFVLREEALNREGVTAEAAIAQARQAADSYLKNGKLEGHQPKLPAPLWGVIGAVASSLCWAVAVFLI